MSHPQECEDHTVWQSHLKIAFWVITIGVWFSVFTLEIFQGLLFLAASIVLLLIRVRLERKHYEWHLGQEKHDE